MLREYQPPDLSCRSGIGEHTVILLDLAWYHLPNTSILNYTAYEAVFARLRKDFFLPALYLVPCRVSPENEVHRDWGACFILSARHIHMDTPEGFLWLLEQRAQNSELYESEPRNFRD